MGGELSVIAAAGRLHAGTDALAERSGDENPQRDDEPYRRALDWHLFAARGNLARCSPAARRCASRVAPGEPYRDAASCKPISASSRPRFAAHHGAALIPARLAPLAPGCRCVRLSSRDSSICGKARTGTRKRSKELLATATRLAPTTARLDEEAVRNCCSNCCAIRVRCAFPASSTGRAPKRNSRSSRRRGSVRKAFGKRAVVHYIISHTETVSDLLEVLAAAKGVRHDAWRARRRRLQPSNLMVVPLFETIEDLRNAEIHHARLLCVAGRSPISCATPAASRKSCSAIPTATRTAASSPAIGSSTAPRPRSPDMFAGTRRRRAAAVPRSRRHGRTRRRPELSGDPRAAARNRRRPDQADRTGRGDFVEIRQPGHRACSISRRLSPRRSRRRSCRPPGPLPGRFLTRPRRRCRKPSMKAFRAVIYDNAALRRLFLHGDADRGNR